jgi:serine/threonine protein phosphatase 1
VYIAKFEKNLNGRDFIVGDIHGEYLKLKSLLEKINFNPLVDRLFAMGDLVDRGQNSKDILQWMNYPWFFSSLGNHEVMIINYYFGLLDKDYLNDIGASWFLKLNQEEQLTIINYFQRLPIAIELNDDPFNYGLVHSSCPLKSWSDFKNLIHDKNIVNDSLWTMFSNISFTKINDIDILFVGHNAFNEPFVSGNMIFLDSGSGYKDGYLSLYDIKNKKFINHKNLNLNKKIND